MVEPIFLQKAKKFNPDKHDIRGWGIQKKIDGVRIQIVINDASDIRIFSRSVAKKTEYFNEYTEKLPHIVDILSRAVLDRPILHGSILDGEAYIDMFDDDDDNFKYVSGTLNRKESYLHQLENGLIKVVVFDLPLEDKNYMRRHRKLKRWVPSNEYIHVNSMTLNRDKEYLEVFNDIVANGGEGIVLYNMYGMYKHSNERCQTSSDILKIKDVNEREMVVYKHEEGTGKLGALVCDDGMGRRVNVGSGFTDPEREMIFDTLEPPYLVEVAFHSETEKSYRLPIFKRLRLDKDLADWTIG